MRERYCTKTYPRIDPVKEAFRKRLIKQGGWRVTSNMSYYDRVIENRFIRSTKSMK